MDKRKLFFRAIVAIVVIGAFYRYFEQQPDEQLYHISGKTMGTITYNVKYVAGSQLIHQSEIDKILIEFNQSLSTYIPDSEISTLNQTGVLEYPSITFLKVLQSSLTVYEESNATFDPTVGPLVNAWGFGPDKKPSMLDSSLVEMLLKNVGLNKLTISDNLITMDTAMYLDFSAIAKGYAVDLVAELIDAYGVGNYMVEIGGEVSAKGTNESLKTWTIGIQDPLVAKYEEKLLGIVSLDNRSMATSGNYRNYYEIDGKKIAHTIDPRTGFNTNHNLLSATVFADNCMDADAYATAFMVLGLEDSKGVLARVGIDAFFVFQKEDGSLGSYFSDGIASSVKLNKTENQ